MTTADVSKDQLPIAFTMLTFALREAFLHVAERDGVEQLRALYERIQERLDDFNSLLTAASDLERPNAPAFQADMPGAVRAGSATIDALVDSVIAEITGQNGQGDPGV